MVELKRTTRETDIELSFNLYGKGQSHIQTGIGFFDHMLESLCKHALWDLTLKAQGDLHVDAHHTVEDVGIVLGQAIFQSLYPVQSIERFGNSVVVMDEASVRCDLDISNRPFLVFDIPLEGDLGTFSCELVEEFFRALIINASLTAHLIFERGKNRHHIIEATFKAFAIALRRATVYNERLGIPSTKGVL